MTITDLRESDADTYRFRFYTDDPEGKYTGEPGVTLSVTDLKVTVSDTDGGVKKLTCSSTCTLPNPTYIWYKNRQPVFNQNRNELNLRDRTVDAGSYSCAVKGYEELRSPAVCVFDKGLQVKVEGSAATEGQTVTLTCSSTCTLPSNPTYIWYKNRQPVSQCESASCSVPVVSEAHRCSPPPPLHIFTAYQVRVPNRGRCSEFNDFRLVTLTSHVMKTLERLLLHLLRPQVQHATDPLQFAYRVKVGVEDAMLYFLHRAHYNLDKGDSPKNTRAVILPSGQRVEGDSVTLTCSSDANPPVLSYYWFNQSSDVELGTGQSYSITSISSQHSGLYYCTAHNQLGQSSSGPSRLDVLCVCMSATGLWKQFAVWGTVGFVSALVLSLINAVVCFRRKRGAVRGADVQAPKSGDDTYSALNPNTTSSDYDTLTVLRPHPVMRRAPENEN
ncbi:B-cell receptor CD22-like [Colossoma macropomum]|uniref:B-cell receptor CD22-like n=1 Tax=Colossoma macropomum TaxID=42526 RepID=UPI0018646807|nr:B-cell receptor CD22-like [Colossoma macropomum]